MSEELKYEDAKAGVEAKEAALENESKQVAWAKKVLETAMTLEAEAEIALAEAAVTMASAEAVWSVANKGAAPAGDETDLEAVRADHAAFEMGLDAAKAQVEACKDRLATEMDDVEAAQAVFDDYSAVIATHDAAAAAAVAAEEARVAKMHADAVVAAMAAAHECPACPEASEIADAVVVNIMATSSGAVTTAASKVVTKLKAMEDQSVLLRVVLKMMDMFI